MRNVTNIGRVGALAVALGVGLAVMVTPGVGLAEPADSGPSSPPDRTALIMGGGTVPTPDDYLVELIKNQYIEPTHPGLDIDYVPVTTPAEAWPITGLLRLLASVLGPQSVWGPGGAGWPDQPWWKLSGLFDLTLDRAVEAGVADLETAMAAKGNDNLVIYGISYSSIVATVEKRRLAEQYPEGTVAPDIDFVMQAMFNLPNGGLFARYPGEYIPILDWSFNGATPTDTQFDTVVINRQYDFWSDFPLYPTNLVADLNAFLGGIYVHTYAWDVSLPADDPTESPAYRGKHGDTDYYFFKTEDLPLFGPLRSLGVPEPVIDVFEPFFREIVELGYDRNIPLWEPTPARLFPTLDPVKVVGDLVDAIGEGINNAQALFGSPSQLSIPVPAATADQNAAVEQVVSAPAAALESVGRDVSDGVSQPLTAVGLQLPEPHAVTHDDFGASQRKVGRELPATRDKINQTIGAVKSVIGDGRTTVRSADSDKRSNAATANPARKTPAQDAVKPASSDIKNVVTKVSDSTKKAMRGGKDDDDHGDGGEGAAG